MQRKRLKSRDRAEIYEMFQGRCAYCGTEIPRGKMEIDHVVPLRKGGEDIRRNMFPACHSCNHYKSTLTLEQFRDSIEKWPDVLHRSNSTYRNAVRFGMVEPKPQKIVFFFEKEAANG